ncbi:hypothetical protein E3E12_05960 [Formicincola oecophyllae]|uniref:Uncharacterized protein n=1 Tax=Formicincola oecophyllae TaxID=2558361 RepID=A0A4Y6UA12_9PROT|nr:hypothetical protein [Formicincola oecophyllae]QDH13800.1 hypothetical protein E3E12_05960 [Formicincola oecophyllae]
MTDTQKTTADASATTGAGAAAPDTYNNVLWKGPGRYISFRFMPPGQQGGWQVDGYVLMARDFAEEADVPIFEDSAWAADFDSKYQYKDVYPGPYPDGSYSPKYDPATGKWPAGYDPHNPWPIES